MRQIYDVFTLSGSFVGYAWADSATSAIELVVGKPAQDWQHYAITNIPLRSNEFDDVEPPKPPKESGPIHDPWGLSKLD